MAPIEAVRSLDIPSLSVLALHWVTLFGQTELVLRMPGLLSASLALWFAFAWMRRILGELPALGGLLFLAVSQSAITAAAQIEQFGLLVLFVCAALYANGTRVRPGFIPLGNRSRSILSACALLTHYVAILVVVALGLYVLIRCPCRSRSTRTADNVFGNSGRAGTGGSLPILPFCPALQNLANMSSSFYHRESGIAIRLLVDVDVQDIHLPHWFREHLESQNRDSHVLHLCSGSRGVVGRTGEGRTHQCSPDRLSVRDWVCRCIAASCTICRHSAPGLPAALLRGWSGSRSEVGAARQGCICVAAGYCLRHRVGRDE